MRYGVPSVVVSADCECDPTLPATITCGEDEKLACVRGSLNAMKERIPAVLFACRCVPAENTYRNCESLFGIEDPFQPSPPNTETSITCGCTYWEPS